jgi:hypothetical protein
MIRRALGLGLMILILKFLMNSVFTAAEGTFVQFFNTANVLLGNMGNGGFLPDNITTISPL